MALVARSVIAAVQAPALIKFQVPAPAVQSLTNAGLEYDTNVEGKVWQYALATHKTQT